MDYVRSSVGFFVLHLGAYVAARVLNQHLAPRDLYGGEQALYAPFFRDMDDPAERWRRGPRDVPPEAIVYSLLFGGFAAWLLF